MRVSEILRTLSKEFDIVYIFENVVILTKIDEEEKDIKELRYRIGDVELIFKISPKYVNLVQSYF